MKVAASRNAAMTETDMGLMVTGLVDTRFQFSRVSYIHPTPSAP